MYGTHQIDIGTKTGNVLMVRIRKLMRILDYYRLVSPLKGVPTISIIPIYSTMPHGILSTIVDKHEIRVRCPLEGGRVINIVYKIYRASLDDHVTMSIGMSYSTMFKWDNSYMYGSTYLIDCLDTVWVPFVRTYRVARVESAIRKVRTSLLKYLKECYIKDTIPELYELEYIPMVYV